jgi:hypothetical protein
MAAPAVDSPSTAAQYIQGDGPITIKRLPLSLPIFSIIAFESSIAP